MASATFWRATIGLFEEHQSSARSARTSATQFHTSSGACGANAKSKRAVDRPRAEGRHGEGRRGDDRSRAKICASDSAALGPGFHVMRSASRARWAWSKVAAVTATPVGMRVTAITPAIARAAPVVDRGDGPPDGGRAGDDRRLRPRHVDVEAVVGLAGDDVAGVDPAVRLADQGELRRVLGRGGDRGHGHRSRGRREGPERGGAPVGSDDRRVAGDERPGRQAPALGGGRDQPGPGRRRRRSGAARTARGPSWSHR